jgi:hypothetical protein
MTVPGRGAGATSREAARERLGLVLVLCELLQVPEQGDVCLEVTPVVLVSLDVSRS